MIEFNNAKMDAELCCHFTESDTMSINLYYFYVSERQLKVQSQFATFSSVVLEFCFALPERERLQNNVVFI
jgi:hypothetical protein